MGVFLPRSLFFYGVSEALNQFFLQLFIMIYAFSSYISNGKWARSNVSALAGNNADIPYFPSNSNHPYLGGLLFVQ